MRVQDVYWLTAIDGRPGQSLAPETWLELAAFAILVEVRIGKLRPTRHWCFVPD
jgi:hypothetical protein